MDELYAIHFSGDHLSHYGRKGMKWGQNIFQTEYEGKGNSVNTNETPAPKKPSVLQNVNDSAIDTFPETIRKKIREHQEKMNEATNLLDSLTENIIQMDSEEKAKVYASSKIQGLISTIKDELNAAYDLIIPASKKGKAEGKNQWTGEDRLMENIAVDLWIRSIFGDEIVNGTEKKSDDIKSVAHTDMAQNSSPLRSDSYMIHSPEKSKMNISLTLA